MGDQTAKPLIVAAEFSAKPEQITTPEKTSQVVQNRHCCRCPSHVSRSEPALVARTAAGALPLHFGPYSVPPIGLGARPMRRSARCP